MANYNDTNPALQQSMGFPPNNSGPALRQSMECPPPRPYISLKKYTLDMGGGALVHDAMHNRGLTYRKIARWIEKILTEKNEEEIKVNPATLKTYMMMWRKQQREQQEDPHPVDHTPSPTPQRTPYLRPVPDADSGNNAALNKKAYLEERFGA